MLCLENNVSIWNYNKIEFQWFLEKMGSVYKDFTLSELTQQGIRTSQCNMVLIQTTPTQDETERLLKMALQSDGNITGLVGWCDITECDEGALESLKTKYEKSSTLTESQKPLLIGLCPMLEDLQQEWLTSKTVRPIIKFLIEKNLIFEARVKPEHLSQIAKFVKMYPKLRVVLDHIGCRPYSEEKLKQWKDDIKAISKSSKNVYFKLSGIYTSTLKESNRNSKFADISQKISPLIVPIVKYFGSQRIIWSSDFPNIINQQEWKDFLKQCFNLKVCQLMDIFFFNSSLVYGK